MERNSAAPTRFYSPLLGDNGSEKYPNIQKPVVVRSQLWRWPFSRSFYDKIDAKDNIDLDDQTAGTSVRDSQAPGKQHTLEWVKGIHIAAGAAASVLAINVILDHSVSICSFCDPAVAMVLFLSKDLEGHDHSLLYNERHRPGMSRYPDGTSFTLNITRQQDQHLASPQIHTDLMILYKYLLTQVVDGETTQDTHAFRAFLDNSTNWQNSTWAANAKLNPVSVCSNEILDYTSVATAYEVDSCMVQKKTENCELMFSLSICLTAIACNLIKLICMFFITRHNRETILLTIGDAISSFLEHPDPTTKGRCAMSRLGVEKGQRSWKQGGRWAWRYESTKLHPDSVSSEYPERLPSPGRWLGAAELTHWAATMLLQVMHPVGVHASILTAHSFALCLGPLIYLSYYYTTNYSIAEILAIGFRENTQARKVAFINDWNPLLLILIANTPQLVLSVAYFLYNNLLTRMLAAAEYSGYATTRKTLRVTWPKGSQRSTYYLSVPYRYAVPLLVISTLLHWLASQSFLFMRIVMYDSYRSVPTRVISSCAFSVIPVLIVTIMVFLIPCTAVAMGLRRFKNLMPVAGHSSAAISATCHPPAQDTDAHTKAVMWGEVMQGASVDDGQEPQYKDSRHVDETWENHHIASLNDPIGYYRHCTFTSRWVLVPSATELYA